MAACLVVLFGWFWSALALLMAMNLGSVAQRRRTINPE
jgi:hypothetical protein